MRHSLTKGESIYLRNALYETKRYLIMDLKVHFVQTTGLTLSKTSPGFYVSAVQVF